MKRIAALTMVRNDDFFLRKWVAYYGRELGKKNLYVVFDGLDQNVPDFCAGVNVEVVEHVQGNVREADRGRIDLLSERAGRLLARYDMVIGTDVDEFLVVDPLDGRSLVEFLSQTQTRLPSISGLGIDVGQKLGEEGAIDASRPFLSQRGYAKLSTRYSKASVLLRPVAWGSGFHRFKGHNFHIDPNLYLFHFGSSDAKILNSRFADKDRIKAGWARHLKKRFRPIRLVSTKKARGENFLKAARITQTLLRPVYAMNKPSMAFWRLVVKIPERFKDVL